MAASSIFAFWAVAALLILVPGAGHNESLRPAIWLEIEQWIEAALPRAG